MNIQQTASVALIIFWLLIIAGILHDIDRKLDRQYQVVVTEQVK